MNNALKVQSGVRGVKGLAVRPGRKRCKAPAEDRGSGYEGSRLPGVRGGTRYQPRVANGRTSSPSWNGFSNQSNKKSNFLLDKGRPMFDSQATSREDVEPRSRAVRAEELFR